MVMPQAFLLLPFLLALTGYALAGLNIWPSFHIALSNASVFVDFATKSSNSTIVQRSLSLVNIETNTSLITRIIPNNPPTFRVEFNCSCFLYAGTFRFLLRQTSITPAATDSNGTSLADGVESTTWWWSSELQVQWPTFHVAVERAGNHSGLFQVGIATNEHFTACSGDIDSALVLEVSYMEYNQIGQNSIDKVRARTRYPIKPVRSQSIELPCAFPFTEKDFIRLALKSPHTTQDIKSSGPLYLSRIFSYKLLVENANTYRSACEGTMTVKLMSPPCAHINGKVLLYKDSGVGAASPGTGSTTLVGLGSEEPTSPPLSFNWLTQGENETEFNCAVFYPGRNKYCFRFVFNYSRSPSPAQTCLVVHRSLESWGPWQPWSMCSVTCGEGVRERIRDCLLPSGGGGVKCNGMVKEQSLCSLEDCVVLPVPTSSLPPVHVGAAPLGSNVVAVVGISLCLAVILATVIVTVWRKLCQTPPSCSSVRRGSLHSPGGRKLSDEASICGNSLQRPSLSDSHVAIVGTGVSASQKDRPPLGSQPLTQTMVIPVPQDPERLSPSGQKMLPPIFGYRLAQQQLKEMKKKGLKEATQLYHVSSSPVHDTLVETSASPTCSPIPSPTAFPLGPPKETNPSPFRIASRTTPDGLSPRVELVLGHPNGGSEKRNRTAEWVEMVERSGLGGLRQGGGGDDYYNKNPYFRRTCSFNDTKPYIPSSALARQFRERSMTQVGSRTLPEGSCWNKSGKEGQVPPSYPFTEKSASEWAKTRLQRKDLRKAWTETAISSQNNEVKHTGTNTDNLSTSERHKKTALTGKVEKDVQRSQGISGIGGPVVGQEIHSGGNYLSLGRAEKNWSRRGPSPIQRNMLARKLKEAQSSAAVRGRQRSSTFSVSSSEQRKNRCNSLPMSADYTTSSGSPYRLSDAEQRMIDLDLSSACEEVEE